MLGDYLGNEARGPYGEKNNKILFVSLRRKTEMVAWFAGTREFREALL